MIASLQHWVHVDFSFVESQFAEAPRAPHLPEMMSDTSHQRDIKVFFVFGSQQHLWLTTKVAHIFSEEAVKSVQLRENESTCSVVLARWHRLVVVVFVVGCDWWSNKVASLMLTCEAHCPCCAFVNGRTEIGRPPWMLKWIITCGGHSVTRGVKWINTLKLITDV